MLFRSFQDDLLQNKVSRPQIIEVTALGAAFLAGLAVGFWKDKDELIQNCKNEDDFYPKRDKNYMEKTIQRLEEGCNKVHGLGRIGEYMKKYWYYIVILIIIIANISLLIKNNELNSRIKIAKSKQLQSKKEVKSVDYLFKIANSKYTKEIDSITVDDNLLRITLNINEVSQIKNMVDDMTAVFEKSTSMVNVKDDKKLILEFE